jgi:hypothetical protein
VPGAQALYRPRRAQGDPGARAGERHADRPVFAQPRRQDLIDLAEAALLAAIAFAGALVFGITGFGAALVTIPLASHVVPLKFALALFALADLASSLSIGFENPKNALRTEWTRLVPMIVAGTVIGATLLVNLPRAAAMAALGVFVILYALYSFVRPAARKPVSVRWAWLAGFLVTGLLLEPAVWLAALAAVPASLAGIAVARRLYFRISRDALIRAVALVLLASGASLIARALA